MIHPKALSHVEWTVVARWCPWLPVVAVGNQRRSACVLQVSGRLEAGGSDGRDRTGRAERPRVRWQWHRPRVHTPTIVGAYSINQEGAPGVETEEPDVADGPRTGQPVTRAGAAGVKNKTLELLFKLKL